VPCSLGQRAFAKQVPPLVENQWRQVKAEGQLRVLTYSRNTVPQPLSGFAN